MKITALVTTLFLGASSAAMAAPDAPYARDHRAPIEQPDVRDHRAPIEQPDVRDHREPIERPSRPYRPTMPSWTALSTNSSLLRGRDRIEVNTRARFSKLKLEASRGSMFIDKVVITFANGERQVVELAKMIGQRSGAMLIDLDGRSRQITKIVVSGKGGFRSNYSLLAG